MNDIGIDYIEKMINNIQNDHKQHWFHLVVNDISYIYDVKQLFLGALYEIDKKEVLKQKILGEYKGLPKYMCCNIGGWSENRKLPPLIKTILNGPLRDKKLEPVINQLLESLYLFIKKDDIITGHPFIIESHQDQHSAYQHIQFKYCSLGWPEYKKELIYPW